MSRIAGVSPVDKSITSLTGSSQTALAANPSRQFMVIVNTGSANIGVNLTGGTAAIAGTGTITLVPDGSILFDTTIPLLAVTVIGTSGQPVCILEG